jgi:hypothetical protein
MSGAATSFPCDFQYVGNLITLKSLPFSVGGLFPMWTRPEECGRAMA